MRENPCPTHGLESDGYGWVPEDCEPCQTFAARLEGEEMFVRDAWREIGILASEPLTESDVLRCAGLTLAGLDSAGW